MELLDPCPLRRVRQTHESVRRLSYRCGDRRFRGVLSSGVRVRVGVRDSRECRRAARFVTSDTLTDGLTPLRRVQGDHVPYAALCRNRPTRLH